MIPLVSLRKQHTMKFVVERNKKMKIINTINFKICEIGIGLACALVTGFISNSNNFLSDAFIGFLMPLVIILPFQINGKSVEKTHDLESALQKLEKTNEKAYDLYLTEVKELTKSINDGCVSLLYKCSYKPNMDLYKAVCTKLMTYFSGETQCDYFYATAECSRSNINWFFDKSNLAGEFLPILNEKCQTKKITDFKRLFIYNNEDLKNPVLYFLVRLHNNIKNNSQIDYCEIDCKFINITHFNNIVREELISDEMGVWGSHCVFMQNNDTSPKGYCFKTDLISKYKRVFESLWNSPHSKHYEDLNITIDTLDGIDEFEREILDILLNNNDSKIFGIQNKDLSLLDIGAIQNWVQGSYPRSTVSSVGAGM